jgi:predicted molibdopterin-dependent oxidoreductase YjgC
MSVRIEIDGAVVTAQDGATILDACRASGVQTPTLCYADGLTPVGACRVCVVELEGSHTLVPACARRAEDGMKIHTDSERVRHSRRMVLEFLASSVDLSLAHDVRRELDRYGGRPGRYGGSAQTVARPATIDNELYVRDYAKCVLCYKCVEACGDDAQNTFAIAAAGRGFEAHIATEYEAPLPDSACVYCGSCIAVCPTGALVSKTEHDMRAAGAWDASRQTQTDTICGFCGVGCTLTVHAQDGRIVKVASPPDNDITSGHLCVKGRFGWRYVDPSDAKT